MLRVVNWLVNFDKLRYVHARLFGQADVEIFFGVGARAVIGFFHFLDNLRNGSIEDHGLLWLGISVVSLLRSFAALHGLNPVAELLQLEVLLLELVDVLHPVAL